MKKSLSLILVCLMLILLVFAGCSVAGNDENDTASNEATETTNVATEVTSETATEINEYEIAMITDKGSIDDKSFNQGTWEGIQKFATDNGIGYQYYKPTEATTAAYLDTIALAIQGGAKIIVTPGYLFEVAIYEAQTEYPDINFILIDGEPHNDDYSTYITEPNVLCLLFAEEQAGFLAGYASVKDGFTKLGVQGGMSVPSVVRFGYGFLQGAESAAIEMGLEDGAISVKYNYSGDFAATPENQARAAGWYQSGTEIIFTCGGPVGNSVMAAAEATTDKWVIGVDVDQYAESETVISSAMKMLGNAVQQALAAYYDGTFEGGTTWTLDSTNDGIGLAMSNARWRTFTETEYEGLFKAVKNGTYIINNASDITIADLGLEKISVIEIAD